MRLPAMFAWAFATLASPVLSALELYVAPHGNDDWSGKLAQPNATHTDGMHRLQIIRMNIRRHHSHATQHIWVLFKGAQHQAVVSP